MQVKCRRQTPPADHLRVTCRPASIQPGSINRHIWIGVTHLNTMVIPAKHVLVKTGSGNPHRVSPIQMSIAFEGGREGPNYLENPHGQELGFEAGHERVQQLGSWP